MDQEHQVLEREDLCNFVDGIGYGKQEEQAPDQAVSVLPVDGKGINDQQDVFQL